MKLSPESAGVAPGFTPSSVPVTLPVTENVFAVRFHMTQPARSLKSETPAVQSVVRAASTVASAVIVPMVGKVTTAGAGAAGTGAAPASGPAGGSRWMLLATVLEEVGRMRSAVS